MEVLGGIGDSAPERVMVLCRSEDTGETFKAFVEMKIVSLEDHCYQSPDRESVKRNTKDAKKNKKFLGHLPYKQVTPPKDRYKINCPRERVGLIFVVSILLI